MREALLFRFKCRESPPAMMALRLAPRFIGGLLEGRVSAAMNAARLAAFLKELIDTCADGGAETLGEAELEGATTQTFSDAWVMTMNDGLVVTLADGSEGLGSRKSKRVLASAARPVNLPTAAVRERFSSSLNAVTAGLPNVFYANKP